jgi:cell division septal protein FtsQ
MRPTQHYRAYKPLSTRRQGNPYFGGERREPGDSRLKSLLARIPPRAWFWIISCGIVLTALFWLLFISNIFIIQNIEVNGTELIPRTAIEELANEQSDQSRALLLSQKKLFVFNSAALKQTINDRYALDELRIVKKLPSTLIITVSEKKPVAVWFEADVYREIDAQGWVLTLPMSSLEGLPTIYNNGSPKASERQINDAEPIINAASALAIEFPKRFSSILIKQITIDNEINTLKVLPSRGAMIYFSVNDSVNAQLDRLDLLLRSELKGRFEKIQYIDLRFKDKLYYK